MKSRAVVGVLASAVVVVACGAMILRDTSGRGLGRASFAEDYRGYKLSAMFDQRLADDPVMTLLPWRWRVSADGHEVASGFGKNGADARAEARAWVDRSVA